VKTNEEVSFKVTKPFSNKRMLVADFEVFESQLRDAIDEIQKQGFIKRSSQMIFQPLEESLIEYSPVEKRAFRDCCEHAGAVEVYLYFGRDKLSNQIITGGDKSMFERRKTTYNNKHIS